MRLFAVLLFAFPAWAQAPVHLEFQCTGDDLQLLGQNCSNSEPCPVYLELSALDTVGPKLFVSGNLHTETSTLASILLSSADGGVTWTEPHPRIPSAGLDQIQFFDFETGWVAGQLLVGTPKDPFLLITHDGGKTWRAQPIFEESHPGTIERFWFDSRDSGALLIDRVQPSETGVKHELLESMTGGETWTLREAGRSPIVLKRFRPAAANTDWRLRADSAAHAYRIERHEPVGWKSVALFPVRIGACKEAEPTLADPGPAEQGNAEAEPSAKDPAPARPAKPGQRKRKRAFPES